MDRMIYTAMSGARQSLGQQSVAAHNLANLSTAGFRAQLGGVRAVAVAGEGAQTRTAVVEAATGTDFTPGAIHHTGRTLDVAIEGRGWLVVQLADGSEAYTRNGSLDVGPNGLLQTRTGLPVLGDGGTISVPADTQISIARDGTISTVPAGNRPAQVSGVGRLKLVNPEESRLVRGNDGLFRLRDGAPAEVDAAVKIVGGALESSNVGAVEAMISMINLSRQFDMQMKLLQNAESNDRQAGDLLSLNR